MLEKEPFGGGSVCVSIHACVPTELTIAYMSASSFLRAQQGEMLACDREALTLLPQIHMAGYIEHFADPRFNQSWDEGRQHWEREAERFWSQRAASCTATNA